MELEESHTDDVAPEDTEGKYIYKINKYHDVIKLLLIIKMYNGKY